MNHFGQQTARHRTHREALVRVAKVEPQAWVAGRWAHHRQHVSRARACAEPRRLGQRLAQVDPFTRQRFGLGHLHRRRRGIDGGKLGSGGQAQTALHGGQHITALSVEHGLPHWDGR
jgi:hypothetical protein